MEYTYNVSVHHHKTIHAWRGFATQQEAKAKAEELARVGFWSTGKNMAYLITPAMITRIIVRRKRKTA